MTAVSAFTRLTRGPALAVGLRAIATDAAPSGGYDRCRGRVGAHGGSRCLAGGGGIALDDRASAPSRRGPRPPAEHPRAPAPGVDRARPGRRRSRRDRRARRRRTGKRQPTRSGSRRRPSSSGPRTSTSPWPTPMPRPPPRSCGPGSNRPSCRARYRDDIAAAGENLALIAGQPNLSESAGPAIATIAQQLPVYTGLVESARTNSRLDFPVGAAYLRRASDLMRTSILPAATSVYDDAARHLYRGYRSGTSRMAGVGVLVAAGVLVVLLLATQLPRRPPDAPDRQPRPRGRHRARRRARRVGHRRVRLAAGRARPVPAGGLGPAPRALDGAHPRAAVAERREPPSHRARNRAHPPAGLRQGDHEHRRRRRDLGAPRHRSRARPGTARERAST